MRGQIIPKGIPAERHEARASGECPLRPERHRPLDPVADRPKQADRLGRQVECDLRRLGNAELVKPVVRSSTALTSASCAMKVTLMVLPARCGPNYEVELRDGGRARERGL